MKGTDLKRKLGSYLPEHVQGVRSPVLERTMSIFKKSYSPVKECRFPLFFLLLVAIHFNRRSAQNVSLTGRFALTGLLYVSWFSLLHSCHFGLESQQPEKNKAQGLDFGVWFKSDSRRAIHKE